MNKCESGQCPKCGNYKELLELRAYKEENERKLQELREIKEVSLNSLERIRIAFDNHHARMKEIKEKYKPAN